MTGPSKILAVDDEADFESLIRQQFRRQIRAQEYDFSFARHGEEALAALAKDPEIELMLLDINMPVMDGLTLVRELRKLRAYTGVPVVLLTTESDADRKSQDAATAMNLRTFIRAS